MSGLDRIRPRTPEAAHTPPLTEIRDSEGKRALFSGSPPEATGFGAVTIDCSACGQHSVVSALQGLRHAVPSVHLPFVRKEYPSYLRCPACGRFAWTRLSLHV